ncbi:hypothetical protein BVG81_004055 [Haliangium sp. UPWRP_2]|nr:hypothetical protein BVG81_004055 [Haliangium sp. UPWRP_2]
MMRLPRFLILGPPFLIRSFLIRSCLFAALLFAFIAPLTASRPASAQSGRRHLTMAEIEALPNSLPIVLRPPTSPTLRPIYTRMVELGEKFNPLNIGLLLSQVLYIESLRTPVIVEQCGAPGLHFARRQNHIRVCYELIPEVNQLLGKPRAQWFEIDSATRAFLMFAMLHEMAHALIKNLGIPVAGREEDAADQLALLFMTQAPDRELAHRILRAPAAFFFRHSIEVEGPAGHDASDEHGSSAQRAADVLCLLYGRHPDPTLAPQLSRTTAACIDFARRAAATWNARLAPHTRVDSGRMF